jgi:hypothetical protein
MPNVDFEAVRVQKLLVLNQLKSLGQAGDVGGHAGCKGNHQIVHRASGWPQTHQGGVRLQVIKNLLGDLGSNSSVDQATSGCFVELDESRLIKQH